MIDERTLSDPGRCPSCGTGLGTGPVCPACGVSLRSAAAAELWQVSVQAAALLDRRRELLDRLRTERDAGVRGEAPPAPTTSVGPAPPPRPTRPEWTRRRVQNLLLALGVLLLGVAALIFLVVSWEVLGVGGRAAVMGGCTALAAGAATVAARRGLVSTAEAVGLLAVGLAVLDAHGARSAGLAGLDGIEGLGYWAGASTVIAVVAAGGAVAVPLRSWRVCAAVLALLAGWLAAAATADGAESPLWVAAAVLTAEVVAGAGLVLGWPFGAAARDAWWVLTAGTATSWSAAALTAAGAAYGEDGSLVLGTVLLLVLAATAGGAAAAVDAADRQSSTAFADTLHALAAGTTVVAIFAPLVELTQAAWLPAALSLAALALLVAALATPWRRRTAPAAVLLLAAVAPAVAAVEPLSVVVTGAAGWPGSAWSAEADASARDTVGPSLGWPGPVSAAFAMVGVAAALALAAATVRTLRPAAHGAVPALAVAVLLAPAAAAADLSVGLGMDLVGASVLVGAVLPLARRTSPGVAWGALVSAAVVLGVCVGWSFAAQPTTLAVLPAAAGVAAAAAVVARRAGLDAAVEPAMAAAVLLVVGEAAAAVRAGGAGWPAVWVLALTLLLAAAVAAALLQGVRRDELAGAATAFAAADSAALTVWLGGSGADAGLAVAVTGAAVVLARSQDVAALPGGARLVRTQLLVAAAAVATGALVTVVDASRLWVAMLAAGVAAAAASLRGLARRELGWAAGGLLVASSWVRLALSDIAAPEAYTVPGALALLALGARRRAAEPGYPSWPAYGPGLTLALVPSLLRAVTDAGDLRPLLLGAAALAVLAVGVARRLQAPLAVGGAVLAVDALVQLSPHLARLYDAVPRWTVIGTVGLLLLAAGATYERRVRELRVLQGHLAGYR